MDKDFDILQAEEQLAIQNPAAYSVSNPSPREWSLDAQEVIRSININPIDVLTTKYQREGPEKLNMFETAISGIGSGIKSGISSIDDMFNVQQASFTSPNMTQEEAERLMQDVLYTRYKTNQSKTAETAEEIKYKKLYDFSNGVGSAIKYAALGLVTGSPAAIGVIAGAESAAQMEADLVDQYIEEYGTIEGYTKEKRAEDLGIAGAYGVFNGLTESMLGVERLAAGALGRYSTLDALARLARMEGKLTKSGVLNAVRRLAMSGIEEGSEEFIQSLGEDLSKAIAGYAEELGSDESFKKAAIAAMYGSIIGGGMGWGLYRFNRKTLADKIEKWNQDKKAGLNDKQVMEIADNIIDSGKSMMLDEIATRVEIRNQYGQAFDTVKARVKEIIEGTGTTPWTDKNKTVDEYADAAARTITIPMILQANKANMPLSEFLDVVKMHVITASDGYTPILQLEPIDNVDDLKAMLAEQNTIIKEQTDAKKLGVAKEGLKEDAQRRKAILQYRIRELEVQNKTTQARTTRKREQADYVTAKDLQPEQTATIETAQTAAPDQDYVLIAGKRIPVEYEVVDLSTIQPSHIDGEVNPNYTNTELQNRASRGTTQDVADLREKAANITPERLLRATTAAEGAPLVNALGEVIAGNGRAEIVRYAYENPETAEKYRTALQEAGFNIEGMEKPILVRRNTTMTDVEQIAAADISNISETSAFDEASQARRDSKYLKDSATPTDFAGKLPMSERRGLMQNNGKWNKRRVQQRYESALLSWLCGNDTKLFENLVLDRNIPQKVLDTLTTNGNLIYETDTKYPEIGLREDIYRALVKMQLTTKDNFIETTQQIEIDGRDVMPENMLVFNWLFTDSTTNRLFLENYATKLAQNHEQINTGEDMFGQKVAPLSKKDALMQALKTSDDEHAKLSETRGRTYNPLFDPATGEVKNPELVAAIASYQNQFAPTSNLNKIAYTSGATYYNRPSTKYVLRGGEGQIVHGWGVYSMEDKDINKRRYRDVFAGKPVYITNEETKEAVPLSGLGMFAENVSSRANRIIGENFAQNAIDEAVATNPKTYGGFIGLYSFTSYLPFSYIQDFMTNIAKGKTTFDNIDQNPDYGYIKERAKEKLTLPKLLKSIIESAHKKYNSEKVKKAFPDNDTRTWYAISEAVRNLTNTQKEMFLVYLDETWEMSKENANLFVQFTQHPENIKRTRGQQLAIEVPNAEEVLNEDMILADQASASKIRAILEDFLPGGLLFDFVEKANENDFEIFREIHNIKAKDLHEFSENVFEEAQEMMFGDNPKMPESGKLLIDYLMNNMKGDDFYVAMMETIPETYIELKSGEVIGEEKDYESILEPRKSIMGLSDIPPELARDTSLFLNEQGIKGIQYRGGTDRTGYVTFSDEAIKVLKRIDDDEPIYYKKRGSVLGQYDPELQTIVLGKAWDEVTLIHEFHHRFLQTIWSKFKQAQNGDITMPDVWMNDTLELLNMLEVDPNQQGLTAVQQEKFAYMVEAYLTGLGVDNRENIAFQEFLHWVPEKYKSIMDLGYLDENNIIQNPMLDQQSIDFFNRWFGNPMMPSLPSAPDAQRLVNATDENGEILPSDQKEMNNREKEWGQDSERQDKADAQLYRAIDENLDSDMRAAMDGEKELMKAAVNEQQDDRLLPAQPTLRDKWFKARVPGARERAAQMAREYLAKNPEHARELAFADPETMAVYDAPVDHGMLIRAVMETVEKGSDEWYLLDNNLAMVKSMSGSALSLPGDTSHQAYLDAKREIEEAREIKAAVNYAGTRRGALDKWNNDIRTFIAKRAAQIVATAPDSKERQIALQAFMEEAKTKFSANTTNAILNKLDLTGLRTKNTQAFIAWAEKQIKQAAHARIDTKEQAELMEASIKAQVALRDIDSTELKDGKYARAAQSGKDLQHWQAVKDKIKKAYIGRWGKVGMFFDNLFGSYAPSAMLMSANTLFFANVPSTAVNTATVRLAAKAIGKNAVDTELQKAEIKRIKQVFNASGVNLAQMDKPTSPTMLHGEKYTSQEQKHWYNFTFDILGREDNVFRVPTFVDALARIATKNAEGSKAKATALFQEYCKLNTNSEEAKIARKQALAVANMAVFTQDGMMASALNHIRSILNTLSRGMLGLNPKGFGLGNILAPFLKTGANITEMGLSSMLALPRTIIYGMKKLQGKAIPDIDKIALRSDWINLAWTSVLLAVLAAINSDDDEWYTEPYESGKSYDPNKPYDSINFRGVWVKLDIFGPIAIPLRAALRMVNRWEKDKLEAVANGLFMGGMDALSDTPLVQQFTDNSLDYMTKQPEAYWEGFGYNQLNKLIPAQAKSASRAISRATDTKVDTGWLGKTLDRKFHRNYGLDGQQLTTNDLINVLTNRLKYNPQ